MKLSSRGRYAIRALFHIAYFSGGRSTQVRDIAERERIPPRFLEQIFQDLKRANIVTSKRGPQGGYSLVPPPEQLSVGDVFRALEGEIDWSESTAAAPGGVPDPVEATEAVLAVLSERLQSCLDEVTIADVCLRARQLGVPMPTAQRNNYVI